MTAATSLLPPLTEHTPLILNMRWIRFFRVAIRSQPATLEKFPNTLCDGSGHSLDFFILGRKQRLKLRFVIVSGGKHPSIAAMWKWRLSLKAESKRWMNVTAPHCALRAAPNSRRGG